MSVRRLPVYLVLDTSGSMRGEPIQALKVGVQSLVSSLRQDPHALESVHIAIITFDNKARLLSPLESLETFQTPLIECPQSGATMTGSALELLCQCVDRDLKKNSATEKGDWRPMAFLMTDGSPNDTALYDRMVGEIARRPFASIVACAAGSKAKLDPLKKLTSDIYNLDTMDGHSFAGLFQWVSSTVSSGNRTLGTSSRIELPDMAPPPSFQLPPPPPEIKIVV